MHIPLTSKLSLSSSPGEAEIIIRMLCEGLVRKGHRVTFLSFDPNSESARHDNSAITLINHAPSLYRLSPYSRWNATIEGVGADPADRRLQIFQNLVDQQTFSSCLPCGTSRRVW
jgi:hypothetical protein